MTLLETRQRVVEALNSVEGVDAHLYKPSPLLPGSTWVVQGPLVKDQTSGQYTNGFFILTYLAPDEVKASEQFSEWWEAIVGTVENVINDIAYIDRVDVVNTGSGNSAEYAMQITARSE